MRYNLRGKHDISLSGRSPLVVVNNGNVHGIDDRAEPFGYVVFRHAEGKTSHVNNVNVTGSTTTEASASATAASTASASKVSIIHTHSSTAGASSWGSCIIESHPVPATGSVIIASAIISVASIITAKTFQDKEIT
jgi:hypothetical protein